MTWGLALALGISVGVVVGLGIVVIVLVTTQAVFSPAAQAVLQCMAGCAQKHKFGTPEFDKCVDECVNSKRLLR
jgi:hypothetical protein